MNALLRGAGVLGLAVVALLGSSLVADEAKKGKKYALLVGVTEYDHTALSTLKYTENDVEELAKTLKSRGAGFVSVRVMSATRGKKDKKDAPTAANIAAALTAILAERTKHDTVLIALSGHGAQIEVEDPDGAEKSKTYPYFCPSDADFEKIRYSTGESKRLVNLNELFDRLGRCGAGTKFVLLDACRNDLKAASSKRNIDVNKVLIPRGVGALFSCSAGQFAHETPKLGKGHGVFFHFVLEGLRGKARNKKGVVTWGSLVEYVKEQVTDEVPGLIGGGAKQEPHSMGNLPGRVPALVGISEAEREYRKGRDLYHGLKGKEDHAASFEHFERSAETGHLLARVYLAKMIHLGAGTAKDAAKGERLAKELLPALKEAAEEGDPQAQDRLGFWYAEGFGTAKDEKQAVAWSRKAAEQGVETAQMNLAFALLGGTGVEKDERLAVGWFRKAAEQGHAGAQEHLGHRYWHGQGVAVDKKEALVWMRKAAEQGSPHAMRHLAGALADDAIKDYKGALLWYHKAEASGNCPNCQQVATAALAKIYEEGKGTARDEKAAVRWHLKAAERGGADNMYRLGQIHADGQLGVKKGDKVAVDWFRKAAEKNHLDAITRIGLIHADGLLGIKKDDKVAVEWYRKAADRGERDAQYYLAVHYQAGRGVTKDEKEAHRWVIKAAEQGRPGAANWAGLFYEHGTGLKQDNAEAVKWYRKAGEQGDGWGARNAGLCYVFGRGVPRDFKEAAKWYQKAGELGVFHTWAWLGDMHAADNLGPKNDKEALVWYRKAAEKGDAYSQFRLAEMYRDGRAVAKDEKQAIEWFQKAAAQKHKEAEDALKKLGK